MKVKVQDYKKTIHDIGLPYMQEAAIWDFYVSKSIAKSTSQGRKVSDYGLKNLPWKEMLEKAGITEENKKILLANSINKTLEKYDLIWIACSLYSSHPCGVGYKVLSATIGMIPICLLSFILFITPQYLR